MQFSELEFTRIPDKSWNGRDFIQAIVDFDNGYGASVVRGSFTYGNDRGLYELAILHHGELCYDSGLAEDVVGWLDENGVTEWLGKIENLPAKEE